MAAIPMPAKILTVLGWFLGAAGGAWLALRVSDWRWAGWFPAAYVVVIAVYTITQLPHPLWMQVCAVALPILGGVLAWRSHHKPYAGEALLG